MTNQTNPNDDPRYEKAVEVVTSIGEVSISLVQRQLSIGYNRAARLMDQMEKLGVVSPMHPSGSRNVLSK